jgi:GT2 family glycosyltransferase
MRDERKAYISREMNGVRLLEGSVGGGCTMTSRELYERVGGFKEHRKYPYWRPDIPYQKAIRKLGYFSAFLVDLELRHAGGAPHSKPPQAKLDWHSHEAKVRVRKDRVKRTILRIPFATTLNERYRWFDPPAPPYVPPDRVLQPREPSEAS